jgi:hypothetical protein
MAAGHFLMAFDVSFLFACSACCSESAASRAISRPRSASSTRPTTCAAPTPSRSTCWRSTSRHHLAARLRHAGPEGRLALWLRRRRRRHADRPCRLSLGPALAPGRDRPRRGAAKAAPAIRRWPPGDGKRIAMLVLLLPLLDARGVGNQQIFNSYLVWGDANYDLVFFGYSMPVTWLISLDAFISTGMIFLSLMFWRWWAKRRSRARRDHQADHRHPDLRAGAAGSSPPPPGRRRPAARSAWAGESPSTSSTTSASPTSSRSASPCSRGRASRGRGGGVT